MKLRFLFVFWIGLFACSVAAQESDVSIRLSGAKALETPPGKIITVILHISNRSARKRAVFPEVVLPENWRLVLRSTPFILAPNSSEIKMLSLQIPRGTRAGKYEIQYAIRNSFSKPIFQSSTMTIVVQAVRKISLEILESPFYVIAGDPYDVVLNLANESNISETIKIEAKNARGFPHILENDSLQLEPGKSTILNLSVQTPQDVPRNFTHWFSVTAQSIDKKEIRQNVRGMVEIIPRKITSPEKIHAAPASAAFRQVFQNRLSQTSGFQTNVLGKGFLDEKKNRYFDFHIRGPDIYDKAIYGEYDEYRLNYSTERNILEIGDRAYSLSQLTQSYRYGRGIEAQFSQGAWKGGAYSMQSRFFQPKETAFAAYLRHKIDERYQAGFNFLRKSSANASGNIFSLEANLKPLQNLQFDMEYGLEMGGSERNQAYKLNFLGRYRKASLKMNYIHAVPDFIGYYSNVDLYSTSLSFSLSKKIRINAALGQQKNDLTRDASFYFSSLNKSRRLGILFQANENRNISVNWMTRSRRDLLGLTNLSDDEESLQFAVGETYKKVNLNASAEFARTRDNQYSQTAQLNRYSAIASYRPAATQSYTLNLSYSNNDDPIRVGSRNLTAGLRVSTEVTKSTHLELNIQTTNYLQFTSIVRDMFEAKARQKLANGHEIEVIARHTSFSNSPEAQLTAIIAEYKIPFGLPVGGRKSAGKVGGRVFDEEIKAPVADRVVRLNELSTITNKEGEFDFPAVAAGRFYLSLERSASKPNQVSLGKMPLELNVEPGSKEWIEIKVTRGAAIAGQVFLYRMEQIATDKAAKKETGQEPDYYVVGKEKTQLKGESRLVQSGGLQNIIVELRGDQGTRRRVSDQSGRFRFGELPPGKWTLFLYSENLPEYHIFEKNDLDFDLKGGEEVDLHIKVVPQKRSIRILHEGGKLIETPKKKQ